MYFDAMVHTYMEIEGKGVQKSIKRLHGIGLRLLNEGVGMAEQFPAELTADDKDKEIIGSMRIPIIHNDPDLRFSVPPIPD